MSNTTANTITLTADDETANALVSTIKAAVNGGDKYRAFIAAHDVTRENVKHYAAALAALAYPNLPPKQTQDGKRTRYGNAVQAAANGLRWAMGKAEAPVNTAITLRVSLSGENGGNITVDPETDADLYAVLVAMIRK